MSKLIPVGVSNRHMHVTQEVLDILFGPGSELTVFKNLYQKGEFASEQIVEMIGPKGKFSHVRILGKLRNRIQIEVSGTDAYHLGINPPVGKFAPLPDGQSLTIKGPKGSIVVKENVMISRRHIHMNMKDAEELGVKPESVIEALVQSCSIRPERYTILDTKEMDHESAEKLAKVTGVIP